MRTVVRWVAVPFGMAAAVIGFGLFWSLMQELGLLDALGMSEGAHGRLTMFNTGWTGAMLVNWAMRS